MTPRELAKIHAACFVTPRPWTENMFLETLQNPFTHLLTVSAGFALIRVIGSESELLTIAVDPSQQRRGFGGQLMDKLIRHAHELGAEAMFLEVAENNVAAKKLYQNNGFTLRDARKNYYNEPDGQKLDALIMVRTLSAA